LTQNERMQTRIKSIYFYLKKRGNAVDSNELADEFGFGRRTIQRDLKTLEINKLVRNYGKGKWTVL
jgi:DeoR/GlpR family transcriptional regulator of sugar metabolism